MTVTRPRSRTWIAIPTPDVVTSPRSLMRDSERSEVPLTALWAEYTEPLWLLDTAMAADPSEIVSGDVPGDGDILMRLMRTRATLPESSPQDRACRDAALSIETLRSENALLREVVVDLWDHMDDQACIEFSASRPRSYLVADQEWQNERARSEPAASSTSSPGGEG